MKKILKNVVILGATGSLGQQSIEVLKKYPKDFKIIGISANTNENLLFNIGRKFNIKKGNIALQSRDGKKSLIRLAKLKEADIIINVLSGLSGLAPTIAALKAKKIVLLGNKESPVAEGKKIMSLSKKTQLIPLDSEHNAIFEIFKKYKNQRIKKITLPCSGGPFLGKTKSELKNITAAQALAHPKWKMGGKISIESATLLNKGFEIIEAHYLFNIPLKKIDVKIHPQCQIHAIVEFESQTEKPSLVAYISPPDMREHIENALLHAISRPSKAASKIKPLTAQLLRKYKLTSPDHKTFPGIKIVLNVFKKFPKHSFGLPARHEVPLSRFSVPFRRDSSSKMTNFLKKEEIVIQKFLQNKIKFQDIYKKLIP